MSETIAIKTRSPRLYLVICNIQSLANVRSLMSTAFAFGCLQVWVVGQSNNTQNSRWIPKQFQEALDREQIELLLFPKWNDCLEHIAQHDRNIHLVGVEIDADSQVLDDMDAIPPFVSKHEDWAILMGNEGQGIHPRHLEACQGRLIRIPQYGTGTASFNVNVACSIVLYHLHQWKYRQFFQEREDEKT
jgi:tRNA G18 (ribose-2'-O)-methylase SpoU